MTLGSGKTLFRFQGQKDTGSWIRFRNTELIYSFLRLEKRFNEIKRQKLLFLLLYKFHTLGWGKLRIHVWSIPYFDMVELLGSRSTTLFLPTSLCVKITHEHAYVLYALFRIKQKVIYSLWKSQSISTPGEMTASYYRVYCTGELPYTFDICGLTKS